MRIGIDGRTFADPAARGVRRYASRLIAALADGFPEDELSVLVRGRAMGTGPQLPPRPNVVGYRRRLRRLPHAAGGLAGFPRIDRTLPERPDVVWMPTIAPLATSRGVPLVLTVQDLSWDRRTEDFTRYEVLFHRIARPHRLAKRARRVVCLSRTVADEATNRWGLDPDQVRVVPAGIDVQLPTEAEIAAARKRHGLASRYILFVGALEPRKAPDVLVAAYERARAAGLDADLALAGAGRLASSLGGDGVRLLGRVQDGDLAPLYAGATALAAPSWLEGFGLTPLEAAACGTAAVVSDLPAFAETLGDAALRVPPGDVDALAAALTRIVRDGDLRERLRASARAAAEPYTWERAARATRAVLAEAAGQ
jgi:glycosyltransferase involved in cell wall biosynthesis